MISYLLSGWRVYVPDQNGNPLYQGRVYFYDASTSQPSPVYADKGQVTSLGTYVDVDNHGFLPSVWLAADHLYKVVVKRKIQADPETWQTLWEIDDVGNPFLTSTETEGESTMAFNTISDIKSIGPMDSARPEYAYVMGWFTPGDTGSPMLFKWNPDKNTLVDDGHWISPLEYGHGSWEQIFDGDLDPRKFGAIPDSGNSCDVSLANCMSYATEPHTYDPSDLNKHYPKTVHFVKEGRYALNAAFDFTAYTMLSQYDSAPVPVVIDDGVFLGNTVTLGKSTRVNSSSPIATYPVFSDKEGYIKFSWFGIADQADSTDQAPKVVIIDKDTSTSAVALSRRLVVNLLDAVPSGVSMNNCILIDAHDGSVSPTLVKLGAYLVSHSTGTPNQLLVKVGNSNVFKFTDGVGEFVNTLSLPEGWQVDNDNFLMQPEGENEKYISLKLKALLDLTSYTGANSGIKFDRMSVTSQADITRTNTNKIYPKSERSVELSGGMWRSYNERNVSFDSYGSHTIDASWTEGKLNITMTWAWGDSSGTPISDYIYMTKPTAVQEGDILCIENCGPRAHGYVLSSLARGGDIQTFVEKSGPLFCIDQTTLAIIDVIPTGVKKHFKWSGSAWEPCTI